MNHRIVLVGALVAGGILAACATPPQGTPPCTVHTERPASIYAVEVTAGRPTKLKAYVKLDKSPGSAIETLKSGSFKADVDATTQQVTVRGLVDAEVPRPGSGCTYPEIAGTELTTVDFEASAPAGTYKLGIDHQVAVPRQQPSPAPSTPATIEFK